MIPWFEWKTIALGPLTLQVWGLFVAAGMLLGMWIINKRSKKFSLNTDMMFNLGFWMIVWGIIGARLFHVVFYEQGYYAAHPLEIFKLWHGGMSSFGGLFGAAFYFWRAIKKQKLLGHILVIADVMSFSAVFGWMLGRVGCLLIHDHLGRHSNCPWAMQTPDGSRLEMALLEIVGMIPLALLFFINRKKEKPSGWYVGILFLYYGVLRFILDFYRAKDIVGADARFLGLTPGQYFAIVLALLGLVQWRRSRKNK